MQIPNYAFYVNIQIIMYRLLITTNTSVVTIGTDILALVNEIDHRWRCFNSDIPIENKGICWFTKRTNVPTKMPLDIRSHS